MMVKKTRQKNKNNLKTSTVFLDFDELTKEKVEKKKEKTKTTKKKRERESAQNLEQQRHDVETGHPPFPVFVSLDVFL